MQVSNKSHLVHGNFSSVLMKHNSSRALNLNQKFVVMLISNHRIYILNFFFKIDDWENVSSHAFILCSFAAGARWEPGRSQENSRSHVWGQTSTETRWTEGTASTVEGKWTHQGDWGRTDRYPAGQSSLSVSILPNSFFSFSPSWLFSHACLLSLS